MKRLLLAIFVYAFAVGPLGCRKSEDEPVIEHEPASFFDEEGLFEGALDLSEESGPVDCAGATEEEQADPTHPRQLRGLVLAPDGRLASRREPLWQRFIPTAHAAPLDGELPVSEIDVILTYVDERGEPIGEVLRETVTDAFGQWCIQMPESAEFGPTLMLIASADKYRLRRPVLHRNDLDIYSQPEALLRLLVEEGFLITDLGVDSYINLDVMAQSAVDLLQPVSVRPGAGLESLLARLEYTLRKDRRLMAAFERIRPN